MYSTWSSDCGALARCATVAWLRTRHGCTPPSPWRTCICCGDDCCDHSGVAPGDREIDRKERESKPHPASEPVATHFAMTLVITFVSNSARTPACADLP